MKTVYFTRHAKSSWDSPNLRDHDRPLNDRGNRDAPRMADYLTNNLDARLDAIVTSSAQRAKETAHYFQQAQGLKEDSMYTFKHLYHAMPDVLLGSLRELMEELSTIQVVAHNPGMTWLANSFSPDAIENIPTTGVFRIDFDIDTWQDMSSDSAIGSWYALWTPKTI